MLQVPICVATAVADHLMHDCAQLGAGYPQSARSTQVVADAHTFMKVGILPTADAMMPAIHLQLMECM